VDRPGRQVGRTRPFDLAHQQAEACPHQRRGEAAGSGAAGGVDHQIVAAAAQAAQRAERGQWMGQGMRMQQPESTQGTEAGIDVAGGIAGTEHVHFGARKMAFEFRQQRHHQHRIAEPVVGTAHEDAVDARARQLTCTHAAETGRQQMTHQQRGHPSAQGIQAAMQRRGSG
jgi:hypothetical protein